MEDEDPREVTVNLNLDGEVHIHHHHHYSSPQPGVADILNSIQDFRKEVMTQLDTSAAKETADLATLVSAVDQLAAAFEALKGQNNAALQQALDAANLDSTTQAAILDANDAAINTELTKVNNLLNPPNTVTGGNGSDTVPAGGGTDTIVGGQGSDTAVGGQGNDTVTASSLTVTSSSANLPDAVTGQAYTGKIDISGGNPPYSVLPTTATVNGLTLDASGNVTGTSTADGAVSFSGTVADSSTPNNHQTFSVSFNSNPAVIAV